MSITQLFPELNPGQIRQLRRMIDEIVGDDWKQYVHDEQNFPAPPETLIAFAEGWDGRGKVVRERLLRMFEEGI